MSEQPLLSLPTSDRSELKEPLGSVETDLDAIESTRGSPLVTIGDVVTYHCLTGGVTPDIAVVDGRSERERLPESMRSVVLTDCHETVSNPAGTITENLLLALARAVKRSESTIICVDGEEDLAVLPAILLAPTGSSVLYGQPGEGMVHVHVTDTLIERVWDLVDRFDGDLDRFRSIVKSEGDN